MIALKTFLPYLAGILGVTTDQLYERQRRLVRAGLLKSRKGRGPGSGVTATTENIVVLLVAALVGDLGGKAAQNVKEMCDAQRRGHSPYTETRTLAEALVEVLDSAPGRKLLLAPRRITVSRHTTRAVIQWKDAAAAQSHYFGPGDSTEKGLRNEVYLTSTELHQIRDSIKAVIKTME